MAGSVSEVSLAVFGDRIGDASSWGLSLGEGDGASKGIVEDSHLNS